MGTEDEAIRFAEIILGACVEDRDPTPGSFLFELQRLGSERDAGRITHSQVDAELARLFPPDPPSPLT